MIYSIIVIQESPIPSLPLDAVVLVDGEMSRHTYRPIPGAERHKGCMYTANEVCYKVQASGVLLDI